MSESIDQQKLAFEIGKMIVVLVHQAMQDPSQLFGPQPANNDNENGRAWWPMQPHFAPPSEMQQKNGA